MIISRIQCIKKIQDLKGNTLIYSQITFTKNKLKTRLYWSRMTNAKTIISKFEPITTFQKITMSKLSVIKIYVLFIIFTIYLNTIY